MELIDIMNEKNLFGSWQTDSNGKMVESIFTDKGSSHSYIQNFYEDEFKKYKEKNINFLEIGIMSGGSLILWSNYFKNAKNIIGVDCTDEYLHPDCRDIEGVDYHFHDAYDKNFVKNLTNLDIIIDDGQHTLDSQLDCIELYLPKLNKGGVLIFDDYIWEFYENIKDNPCYAINSYLNELTNKYKILKVTNSQLFIKKI